MAVGALVARRPGSRGRADVLDAGAARSGLVVALASSVIPYSLELESLRRLPARVFGVLMSLEPAVAALAGLSCSASRSAPRLAGDRARGRRQRGRDRAALLVSEGAMSELLAARRGLIALSGREVARVLKLWTQTVAAPILSSALFIVVFGLSLGGRISEIDGVSVRACSSCPG